MDRKILIAIADGVGDRPCPILDGKTPLQAAVTPTLNRLAAEGATGIMDLVAPGTPVGTDMGHLAIFGYTLADYPGRGPIEAAGIGLELQAGDLAFRCNFATVDDNGIVLDRRAGRIRERTQEIAVALHGLMIEDVAVLFKEATEHRAVLVLRGKNLSAAITDSDPKAPNEGVPYKEVKPKDKTAEAIRTAHIVNLLLKKAHEIMKALPVNKDRQAAGLLPANFILTRGAGMMPDLQKKTEVLGFKGACIAGESTVLGVARIAGYTPITDVRMTGSLDTDVKLKATLAVNALATHDVVVVHIKAPDLMGHDGDPQGKVKAIEVFEQLLTEIEANRPENVVVALAADHSTPCEKGEHSGEPVPIVFHGSPVRVDTVTTYDEIACSQGGLGRIRGNDFNALLLDYLNLIPKRGN